ncbi:phage major tail protein, TP901-1 family [Blastochloris sulfoviridis]|uniref:Phage major tail protein, TP901-1 family n=1 Tax=Blastochloris sulfoviridis TaxID=50712 RepID=A0A5M6HVS2_9HYPH|nr:phage major tail protein, TP901-1 family [Blastochloris sulfoviridis]KAA5599835.1 phage major tail protein, TP901-1 family [Blastochloris sulfoviridis]
MPAQKGKDLLLKVNDGAAFVTVAGLRTNRFALNAQTIDVTHAESAGRWRELLSGAGVRKASVAGSGIFKDTASDTRLRQLAFDGEIASFQLVVPDFGIIEGPFQITALEYAGRYDGEVTHDIALESAGALTFTAL